MNQFCLHTGFDKYWPDVYVCESSLAFLSEETLAVSLQFTTMPSSAL